MKLLVQQKQQGRRKSWVSASLLHCQENGHCTHTTSLATLCCEGKSRLYASFGPVRQLLCKELPSSRYLQHTSFTPLSGQHGVVLTGFLEEGSSAVDWAWAVQSIGQAVYAQLTKVLPASHSLLCRHPKFNKYGDRFSTGVTGLRGFLPWALNLVLQDLLSFALCSPDDNPSPKNRGIQRRS